MVTKGSGMSRESHGEEGESPSGQKLLNQINKFHRLVIFTPKPSLYTIIYPPTQPPNYVERSSIQRFVSHVNSLDQKRHLKKNIHFAKKKKVQCFLLRINLRF